MVFNNRFNNKDKDPLVEAAKGAMMEGEIRRQAINAVNEEFGVFNRNAVIREQLAAYDARIEEAVKCMKEGNKENKEKKKEHEEKTGLEHVKKMGGFPGQSLKRTARSLTKEGNDGNLANNYPPYDKVTRGDVIAGRLGKDQMGGKKKVNEKKMWEGSGVTGEDPGMEVARKAGATQQTQTPSSTPARTGNAAGATIAKAKDAINEAVSRKHFQQVADLIKGHESQEKRNELASHHAGIFAKQNPRFDHARFHKAAGSTAHEEPKKMEEAKYSYTAARRGDNIGKKGPGTGFKNLAKKAAKEYGSEESGKRVAGAILKKIRAKHMEEQVTLMPTTSSTPKQSSFGSAFAAARKAGQSTFSMGGKSYTTQMKGEKPAATSSAPKTGPVSPNSVSRPNTPAYRAAQNADSTSDAGSIENSQRSASAAAQNVSRPSVPTGQEKLAADAAKNAQAKPVTSPVSGPGGTQTKPMSAASSSMDSTSEPAPKPASTPASSPAPTTSQPGAPKDDASASVKKLMSMNESVQVGANRYRIV